VVICLVEMGPEVAQSWLGRPLAFTAPVYERGSIASLGRWSVCLRDLPAQRSRVQVVDK